MLEIQKFLREGNRIEDLRLPPYSLKVVEHEDGRILFKYSPDSDFSYHICHEARGLILDRNNDWEVVCRSFDKFFNYGEQYAAQLEGQICYAYEKIDGSLINAYWWKDNWCFGMNGTIDAKESKERKFYNAIAKFALEKGYACAEALCYELPRDYTHMFELVGPNLQIVLMYENIDLYYLGSRNKENGEYKIIGNHFSNHPTIYTLSATVESAIELVTQELNDGRHEGVVLADTHGNRVKVKCPKYFELHRTTNNGRPDILSIVIEREEAEFLLYFPQYADEVDRVRRDLNFYKDLGFFYQQKLAEKFHLSRKDYALYVQQFVVCQWQSYAYKLYNDHELTWEQFTKNWDVNAWRRFIEK